MILPDYDRGRRPSIAVIVQGRERYQSLARPTFRDHCGTTFPLPLFRNCHRGNSLGGEQFSKQGGQSWRYRIMCIVQRGKALQDSLTEFASEHAEIIVDRVWN